MAELADAADLKSAESGKSDQDASVTAENFTPVAGAPLVAFGTSRRLFTDRTRTVAASSLVVQEATVLRRVCDLPA